MYSILFLSFILGVSIGSFLNVVIYRLPANRKITGRSSCPNCNHVLSTLELIPVASYLIQGRKCKSCKTPISSRYMIVELLTGLLFLAYTGVLIYIHRVDTFMLLGGYIIISSLVALSFIDFDTMKIPNIFHFILLGASLLIINDSIPMRLLAGVGISLPLFALAILTSGLGIGDVKLMFVSGFLLGVYNSLIVLIIGGVSAIIYSMIRGIKKKERFPFGPFLSIGIYITLIYSLL